MDFWCYVNEQDVGLVVGLVEGVQQGLRSRSYCGGQMCFKFEEPVHRFQNILIDLMTGEPRIPPGDPVEEMPTLTPESAARSPVSNIV